jgi:type III secretion system FlhB-like substrate exporter
VEALSALPEDSEVPEELFEMVAVVLSWAYWIKSKTPEEGPYD